MKQILCVALMLCCLVALVGCGSNKPDGMSDDTYKYGVKILEVVDQYIDADITKSEAVEQINELKSRLGEDEGQRWDLIVESAARSITHYINEGDFSKVKELRENLASNLGK